MSTIVADERLGERVSKVREAIEVVDAKGGHLGIFKPIGVLLKEKNPEIPQTAEELTELYRNRSGGTSLAEILQELEAKWPSQ